MTTNPSVCLFETTNHDLFYLLGFLCLLFDPHFGGKIILMSETWKNAVNVKKLELLLGKISSDQT